MSFKYKFNRKALEEFGQDLRRASWGVASGGFGLSAFGQVGGTIIGVVGFLACQALAVYLKSLDWENDK